MKLFLTGATGFVGSRVVSAFLADGYEVVALVRSDKGAAELRGKGVTVVKGDLTSYGIIGREAAQADVVVHTAFQHDFDSYEKSSEIDRRVSSAIIDALKGSNRPFIATSGASSIGETSGFVDESFTAPVGHPLASRAANEQHVLAGAKEGVRVVVLRLPFYVYDKTGSMFTWTQEQKAIDRGHTSYVDDGSYGASAVHVEDAAALYLLAVKHAKAGHIYHAASGQATAKQIAEAIAAKHKLEARSISRAEADEIYGPELGMFFSVENLNDSKKALKELGWQPKSDSVTFLDSLAGKVS